MGDDDDFIDLIERARSDDPEAVRDLLGRFQRELQMMVRARLPRRMRSQYDSLDFVQAVWQSFFADLKERPREFANTAHLRGFLQGVVRNKVDEQHRRLTRTRKYDLAREERLYVRRGDREVWREVVAPGPSPSETAQAADRLEQLMAGRGARDVEVVRLRRQGLTHQEIAERLGIDERSVRRIIESVRARLEGRT